MKDVFISDSIVYVGVDDKNIDLFESQYVVPNGVSYNSYVILDDKITIMDTVDRRGTEGWLANLKETLGDKKPYYVVVSHLEPDHAGNLKTLLDLYPDIKVIGNPKTFTMIAQFFDVDLSDDRKVVVGEGDTVNLGTHTLQFFMAPLVHWPEVMVTYESSEKILFSADGFGKFGALSLTENEDWACEARRYYFNIVGKYGIPVQTLLKKAAGLDIATICPLHGPILTENLGYYLDLYNTWSSYEPESKGILIAYASIHGNTGKAAEKLAADMLREMRYGEDGYFWADDTEGNNIVLLGRFLDLTFSIGQIDISIVVEQSVIIICILSLTIEVEIIIFDTFISLTILAVLSIEVEGVIIIIVLYRSYAACLLITIVIKVVESTISFAVL